MKNGTGIIDLQSKACKVKFLSIKNKNGGGRYAFNAYYDRKY